tara:strand:+ start:42 stop:413 length:372 start_codon:yes stop_codon:yes gene_type:complete
MSIELRVVNYTSTDEDGEKTYTRHAIQTRRKNGPWTDAPVTEIYEERGVEADVPDNKPDKAITKLKAAVVAATEADNLAEQVWDKAWSDYDDACDALAETSKARTAAIEDYDAAVEAHVREGE